VIEEVRLKRIAQDIRLNELRWKPGILLARCG